MTFLYNIAIREFNKGDYMPKRIFLLFILFLICCILCSCESGRSDVYSAENWKEAEKIKNINQFGTIVTEKEVYSTEDTVINYTLYVTEDYTDETVPMGVNAIKALHKLIDGKWYVVPLGDNKVIESIYMLWNAPPGAIDYREIDLSKYFQLPLPAGEYRILTEDNIVSNTFTIE